MGLATQQGDTVAVARRLFDVYRKSGSEAMGALLHPDVEAHPAIDGGPTLVGRDAVLAWWADVSRRSELEARPIDFELRGNVVIVRGYLRHRDGRTLAENQVFWLYEVHDGLVTRMESHPSRNAALAAAGPAAD